MSVNEPEGPDEDPVGSGYASELLKLCSTAYSLELSRKTEIEKKAQFYLALITALLGILSISDKLGASPGLLPEVFARSLGVSFFLLIVADLFCVLRVALPRRYDQPYPKNLVTYTFQADSKYKTKAALIRAQAEELAMATEIGFDNNIEKSKWLLRLSFCAFLTLVNFALLITALSL